MSTGSRFVRFVGIAVLCLGCLNPAYAVSGRGQRKTAKKPPQLPTLPSGPTGRPVPQIPLDSIAAVPPQVNYQNGQLSILAPNSTLADVLRAVKKQTGAEIDVPAANERVVTRLGPGPAREVIAQLLNGSRFNYVLLGSSEDSSSLTRVVLVAKSGAESVSAGGQLSPQPVMQQVNMAPPPEVAQDSGEAEQAEEPPADDANNGDQAAAEAEQAEQPAPEGDQSGIKTPQQMLQEMQQRQLQMQQQQAGQAAPGAPAAPGSGMPPHPPQEP